MVIVRLAFKYDCAYDNVFTKRVFGIDFISLEPTLC